MTPRTTSQATWAERAQYPRIVPDGKMTHAQRVRRPVVVVREALRVEDLNHRRHGRYGHHDEMLQHKNNPAVNIYHSSGRPDWRNCSPSDHSRVRPA